MRTLIIAEAGVNHNGCLELARRMIEVAALSGVDYVKFQSFRAKELTSPKAGKAEYQMRVTDAEETQIQMLERLELSLDDHRALLDCCSLNSISFLSSPFSDQDLDMLLRLGIKLLKIPSGEVTNYPLLKRAGEAGLPIILSTGMASLGEIEAAIKLLTASGLTTEDLTLLQCTTEYPTPYNEVNLRAMVTLGDTFGTSFGLSDHTQGIAVSTAAVALGAVVVEKHFTLDKALPGPDHLASLEPDEISALVTAIRQVEAALGSPVKSVTFSEQKNRAIARKSLFLRKDIDQGEEITDGHLQALRPETGMSPMKWPELLGRKASRSLKAGHQLSFSDIAGPGS